MLKTTLKHFSRKLHDINDINDAAMLVVSCGFPALVWCMLTQWALKLNAASLTSLITPSPTIKSQNVHKERRLQN